MVRGSNCLLLSEVAVGLAVQHAFIYGSCVSRDAFELLPRKQFKLHSYKARQSFASVSRNALAHWPEGIVLQSKFQQAMVHDDWLGGAWWRLLQAKNAGADLFLFDLTDERHGFYRFEDGSVVTNSINIMGTELEKVAKGGSFYGFGTDAHFAFWSWCANTLIDRLKNERMMHQVRLLKVPWAVATDTGEFAPSSAGMTPLDANLAYERYYALLEEAGMPTIILSDAEVLADSQHQWGVAPFHYTPHVYETINRRLIDSLTES